MKNGGRRAFRPFNYIFEIYGQDLWQGHILGKDSFFSTYIWMRFHVNHIMVDINVKPYALLILW